MRTTEGWARIPLAELASIQGGIQKQPKRAPKLNKYPFLRVANVTADGLDLREVHEVELFGDELEKLQLVPGDLLVVEGNGSPAQVGRAAVWDGSISDCVHQNHLIRVRPGERLLPRFLGLLWNAPNVREELTAISSSTSGLHTLSVSKLKRIEIPVPPIAEQRRIVEILEDHLSRLDAEERYLQQVVQRVDAWAASMADELIWSPGWSTRELGSLLREPMRNGRSDRAVRDGSAGVRTLTLTAVTRNEFTDVNTKLTTTSPEVARGLWLEPGDIFVQRSNTPDLVGTAARFEGRRDWAIFPICSSGFDPMRT